MGIVDSTATQNLSIACITRHLLVSIIDELVVFLRHIHQQLLTLHRVSGKIHVPEVLTSLSDLLCRTSREVTVVKGCLHPVCTIVTQSIIDDLLPLLCLQLQHCSGIIEVG